MLRKSVEKTWYNVVNFSTNISSCRFWGEKQRAQRSKKRVQDYPSKNFSKSCIFLRASFLPSS